MKKIIFISLFNFFLCGFMFADTENLLLRKWMMIEMQVEGNKINEDMLERQRQKGMITILEFRKGGACYLYLKTPKGKTTKRNQWQLSDDKKQLTIKPEGSEPPQVFMIEKISSKKMTLSFVENGQKQMFVYKSIKE